MKYRVTLMRSDRTDVRPWAFGVSGFSLWAFVLFLCAFPFVTYWIIYTYVAPQMLGVEIETLRQSTQNALGEAEAVAAQFEALEEDNQRFRRELLAEREVRAGLESKITIAETARADLAEKSGALEEEVLSLRRSVRFYEQFMRPNNERAVLQCFNVRAALERQQVRYRLSMIKTDRRDRGRMVATLRFRVLAGASARDIDLTQREGEALHTRRVELTYDSSLSGTFQVEDLPDGVRLLDIKGYDSDDNVIMHCWKAF